jgi:hypothetical protein
MRNARAKARRIGRPPQTQLLSELTADIAREFLTSIPTEQSCRYRVVLVHAYDRDLIEDRIRKIYEYASWCFNQPETGDKDTDPSSGVAVSFMKIFLSASAFPKTCIAGCRRKPSMIANFFFDMC